MTINRPQTVVLLDRARAHLNPAAITRYIGPCDPGTHNYLKAMKALLAGGESVLDQSMCINGDLDFDEPIGCSQWDRPSSYSDSKTFRWYRLMASAAALLLKNRMVEDNEHYFLANILLDTYALESTDEAPLDLVSDICRETFTNTPIWAEEVKLFCLAGELLMAGRDRLTSEEIDSLCKRFENVEQEISLDSGYASEEYFWGTTFFTQLHPTWFALIDEHFPSQGRARFLRNTLLEHGANWKS